MGSYSNTTIESMLFKKRNVSMQKMIVVLGALVSLVCLQIIASEKKEGLKTTLLQEKTDQKPQPINPHLDNLKDFYTGDIDSKIGQQLKVPTRLISVLGSAVLGGITYSLALVTKAAGHDTYDRYKKGQYCSSFFEGVGTLIMGGIDTVVFFSCLSHARKCITGPGADD
jgi:hypothetical protein